MTPRGAVRLAWGLWGLAVALMAVVWHPAFGLLAFLLLLFPHGRLPSPRWRPFAWFTVAVYLTLSLAAALSPGAFELYYPQATPPVHLPVAGLADPVFEWLVVGQLLVLATALVSVALRLRRATGEERQQVKWFVYTVITVVLVFVTTTLILGAGYLFPVFGLIPISVAVAVFRYRLYDIDRLINRTLASELRGVVDHTVQPASASLWLRPAGRTQRVRVG